MTFDPARLSVYPTQPGVYLMKETNGTVIYVGKANNLRNRLRQYFMKGGDGRDIIPFLVADIAAIDVTVVGSEKEALILENTLIKKFKPKYNALLKDDRSFIALKIRTRHPWPIVELVRSKGKPKGDGLYFGPYTNAFAARQTLDLLQRLFPLRQCSDQELLRRTRPCILYDMKRCIAPCVKKCSHEEYDLFVEGTIKFLRGQAEEVIEPLKRAMENASEKLNFEEAQALYTTIRQVESTLERQKAYKLLGGDTDALALFRQGEEIVLSQVSVRMGRLQGATPYSFSNIAEEDHELIANFILQHYEPLEEKPKEILLPFEIADCKSLEEILGIRINMPKRGDKKGLVDMAFINAEATFKREKDQQELQEKALIELQEKLHLSRFPEYIECFDNSNFSGSEAVSALVTFKGGVKYSAGYRKYKIRVADSSDDYGMLREALSRRYRKGKEEETLPDLLVIDGGKGHLSMAIKVLESLDIASVDVIGVAKEEGRHDKGITQEQIFLRNVKDPILLRPHSAALLLLQRIRDEAHRSAIGFQKKRRSKVLVRSLLDDIPGVGPFKKRALLKHFGSLQQISKASQEELLEVRGISEALAREITVFFSK